MEKENRGEQLLKVLVFTDYLTVNIVSFV